MKLLLDEHLSKQIAEALRERGHDVVAVQEQASLRGLADRELIERASVEGRAVVTKSLQDFRPLGAELTLRGRSHAGLVLLPSGFGRAREGIGALIDDLEALLSSAPKDEALRNREVWLSSRTS